MNIFGVAILIFFFQCVRLFFAAVDVTDLEGEWTVDHFYNFSNNNLVARMCNTQSNVKWTISGDQWNQNTENAVPNKDLMFNSNGEWTIKEVTKGDTINYVKIEVLKDSASLIGGLVGGVINLVGELIGSPTALTACFAYMRAGEANEQLLVMFNYTDPEYCTPQFIYFHDECSNLISFPVATCTGGKCAASTD